MSTERKRFDFMAYMENYQYILAKSEKSGLSMSEELNRIIEKHRCCNDLQHARPLSERAQ